MERKVQMIDSKFSSIVLLLAGLAVQGCSQPRATVALDESPQAEIELMFDQYIDTFSQAKWDAVDDFWHTPGWFAKGSESIHLADDVAVQTLYRDLCNNSAKMAIRTQTCLTQSLSSSMPLAHCFVFRTHVGTVMEKSCRLS